MAKLKIEIPISILTIIIGMVVVTIGYFSYKSLSEIVFSIHQGTRPDNKIFVIKEIASNLTELENTVRLYSLTNSSDNLEAFYTLEDTINQRLKYLEELKVNDEYDVALIDSFSVYSGEKLEIWNEILKIYLSKKGIFPSFSKFYSNLDDLNIDTASVDTAKEAILKNIADHLNESGDSMVISTQSKERKEIRKTIQKLEWDIYRNRKKRNVIESALIEQNGVVVEKINRLINEAETREAAKIIRKTREADNLAQATYKRLTLYTGSAVLLLFLALMVLFSYLRKARAAERVLTDARKKAEALARAKEQFAANISHELRTPVNAIFGLTEQVLHKKLDTDTSEMVSVIYRSADHLRNIVNDTLDFSKIISENLILESVNFSPGVVLEEVYYLFKYEANKKGVDLKYIWNGEQPLALKGDPLRLKQIIINLVGNAIKFTEKGEILLIINGAKINNEVFELEIGIVDTGIGIEKDKINMVFDEYFQIWNPEGKKFAGTGLGLSIVKKLVEIQGGKIKIDSDQGKGTKVTVNIRYNYGDESEILLAKNSVREIPEKFSNISVLIADDEEYNRFLLRSIFQKWEIEFVETENGREVIDAACRKHFDFILMDINMPEVNGITAAKEILKCSPDVKIIAVSAATDHLDQEGCFKAGMNGFLFKPFTENELFNILNSLLNGEINQEIKVESTDMIELSDLKHIAGGDDKFLEEMIRLFIKSTDNGISAINNAIKNENWNSVHESAHKMAAPVKHIGAINLYRRIKILEKISKEEGNTKDISAVFNEIKMELRNIKTLLKLFLENTNVE